MIEQLDQHETPEQQLIVELLQPQPTVIGIEGGPCGGKTTLVNRILAEKGEREAIVLPEAATQWIEHLRGEGVDIGDLVVHDRHRFIEFEKQVLQTIVQQIESAKDRCAGTDAIIIADRTDIGAYVSKPEYASILQDLGYDQPPMLSLVDQMYYLPSVAQTRPELYESLKATNSARYETLEQAQATCSANLSAVARHPELHVAWGGNFDEAITKLAASALRPEDEREQKLHPINPESTPTILKIGQLIAQFEITQSYYRTGETDFRLRRAVTDRDEVLHYFTIKTGEGIVRNEVQRTISADQYQLLARAPKTGGDLFKERSSVLMSTPDGKRLWSVDQYHDRRLPRWVVETDVESVDEALEIERELAEGYVPATQSAQQLAKLVMSQVL